MAPTETPSPPPPSGLAAWIAALRVYLEPATLRMLFLGFSAGLRNHLAVLLSGRGLEFAGRHQAAQARGLVHLHLGQGRCGRRCARRHQKGAPRHPAVGSGRLGGAVAG